jgi:hypothetical protein
VKGDEARVVAAFCSYMEDHGWTVDTEVKGMDVLARRGGETIYAEAKGRAGQDTGTALDILYGQLLRRMRAPDDTGTRYAVVVPDSAVTAAQRVPEWVRSRLAIDMYAVTDDGHVQVVEA